MTTNPSLPVFPIKAIQGTYKSYTTGGQCEDAHGTVAKQWDRICAQHGDEFPYIRSLKSGTFNVVINEQTPYEPPRDAQYRHIAKQRGDGYGDGNHISPEARVISINAIRVQSWIYRGGHGNKTLELLSVYLLAEHLRIPPDSPVVIEIEEIPLYSFGMPGLPGHLLF